MATANTHSMHPYCRVCLTKNNLQKPFKTMQYVMDITELILPGMSLYLQVNRDSFVCDKCYFFLLAIENFRTQVIEAHRLHWSNGVMNCVGCSTNNDKFQKFLSTVNKQSSICIKPYENSDNKHSSVCIKPYDNIDEKKTILNTACTEINNEFNSSYSQTSTKRLGSETGVVKQLRAKRIKDFKADPKSSTEGNLILNDLSEINDITENESELLNFKQFVGNKNYSNVNIISNVVLQKYSSKSIIDETIEEVIKSSLNNLKYNEKKFDATEEHVNFPDKSLNMETSDASSDCVIITINDLLEDETPLSSEEDSRLGLCEKDKQNPRSSVIVSSSNSSSSKSNSSNTSLLVSNDVTPVIVKTEVTEDENPGFFNRKNHEGYYNCKLCDKNYKTSLGLYHHTREKHQELKIHHCSFCNFFCLWKSALVRHTSMYHSEKFEDPTQELNCFHCSFTSYSKDDLREHILQAHVNTTEKCALCSEVFKTKELCEEHVHSVHMLKVQGDVSENPEVCAICNLIVDNGELDSHNMDVHDAAAKLCCPVCAEPYREENMVECTKCKKWCCYECVGVSDNVATDENWICPSCKALQTQPTTSSQRVASESNFCCSLNSSMKHETKKLSDNNLN